MIDKNVLIQSPYAIEFFYGNYLVITFVAVDKLDGLKEAEGEIGENEIAAY